MNGNTHQTQNTNQKSSALKSLQVIFRAVLLGQVFFGVIAVVLVQTGLTANTNVQVERALQITALILAFAGVLGGFHLYSKKVMALRYTVVPMPEKISRYRSASFLFWFMLEVPVVFSIVCYLLTGNLAFMALAVMILLICSSQHPSKNRIMLLLGLSAAEMENV